MTGPEYDAELEAFLKRRSPMHRRLSDIDGAEPSVELDRLVLNRAREAIDTPNQPLFRSSRWALPMGLAASILIAFTVVLNIDHRAAKPAAATSPANASAPAVARAAPVNDAKRMEQPRVLSDSAAHEQRTAQPEKRVQTAAELAKRYELPESADAAYGSANKASQLAASSRAGVSPLRVQTAPPAAAPAEAGGATGPTAAADRASKPTVPPTTSAKAAADPHSSPDTWLREINRLRAAGRTADADRELVAFRAAYPTHPAYSVAKPPAR